MIPGLWRCQTDLLLDALGLLVQPFGLLLLLGFWGGVAAFNFRRVLVVGPLVRILFAEAAVWWTLSISASVVVRNPTSIIEGAEYLGIAVSWSTVLAFFWRQRGVGAPASRSSAPSSPGLDTDASKSQPYRQPPEPTPRSRARESVWPLSMLRQGLRRFNAMRATVRVAIVLTIAGLAVLVVSALVLFSGGATGGLALPLLPAAAAWTMAIVLRHPMPKLGGDAHASASPRRSLRWLGAVAMLGVCTYLVLTLVVTMSDSDSPWRIPGRLGAWGFALKTAPMATDECLVHRVARYGGAPSTMDRSSAGTLGEAIGDYWEEEPGRTANGELIERGRSALPAIERGIRSAIRGEHREWQAHLVGVLERVARWPEGESVVREWANATPPPVAQRAVKKWVKCIDEGRREDIGKATDSSCRPIPGNMSGPAW